MTGSAKSIARPFSPLGLTAIVFATIAVAGPAVTSARASSSAGVENGLLVIRDEQPSLSVTLQQRTSGVLVQFGGAGESLPGAGCTAMPEGIECSGASAIEVFDRDEFLDRDELGQWVFERIRLNVQLSTTVHGRAGREWITHDNDAAASDGETSDLASPVNLAGGTQEDLLQGGAGADTLNGGPGVDLLRGRAGDDHILARDGEKDSISCGPGFDTVEADADEQWNLAPEYWCEVINGRRAVNGQPPTSSGTEPRATRGRCARAKGAARARCIRMHCGRRPRTSPDRYRACVRRVMRKESTRRPDSTRPRRVQLRHVMGDPAG
jgi:hypothetical protein